jgi:hypothetical protein
MPPMHGRTRCRMHGGKSPKGAAVASFSHGGYSRYLPKDLAEKFAGAVTDPDLLSSAQEVALLRARLSSLLSSPSASPSVAADIDRALTLLKQDPPDVLHATQALYDALDGAALQSSLWQEVYDIIDLKTKAADREVKRLAQLDALIPADQALAFAGAVLNAVKRHVQDPATQRKIADDISALASPTPMSRKIGHVNLPSAPPGAPESPVQD